MLKLLKILSFYWKELLRKASLLGNMLSAKGILRVGYGNKEKKGIFRAGFGSKDLGSMNLFFLIFQQICKCRNIRMYLESMEFILEIICLKKGWGKCDKSWWICWC